MTHLLIFTTVVLISGAHILLKKGLIAIGQLPSSLGEVFPFLLNVFTNTSCISAVILILLAAPAWVLAIARAQLNFVYPFAALSYVLVALFSLFLFKENMGVLRWLGIIVTCADVSIVSRS